MGQIANRMLIEIIFKVKEKLVEKKGERKRSENDEKQKK